MPTTHPNEELLRRGYAAFARGDMDGYWQLCSDDFAFNVPGRNQLAGTYKGRDRFLALIGKVMELCGGTFQEEVHDVLANDDHGVVLAIHRFQRRGRVQEYRTAHVYHIGDGKLTECWEQPLDQYVFDEAWR